MQQYLFKFLIEVICKEKKKKEGGKSLELKVLSLLGILGERSIEFQKDNS